MDHLHEYQIGQHPAHYIPDFITESEESVLLRKISESPAVKWRTLSNRRLQVWGGDLTKSGALIPQDLPACVTTFPNLIERLRETGSFASTSQGTANHIILNEYLPGQGIMPHQDGPAYHPVVATLSLGSHTVMDYYLYQKPISAKDANSSVPECSGKAVDPKPVLRLLLEPRSLVITHGSLYTEHLHGITGTHYDIFLPSDHEAIDQDDHDEGFTQVIPSKSIANSMLLGDMLLRDRLTKSTTNNICTLENSLSGALKLERRTRTSLTCRVVERTAPAVGKLVKLR